MSLPLNFPSNRVPLSINTRPSFISKPIATHQPSIAISSFSNLLFPVATPNHSTNDGARHSIFGKIIINPSERITFLERKIMKIILNVYNYLIIYLFKNLLGRKNQ